MKPRTTPAQKLVLAATAALVVGLVVRPAMSLHLLWDMIIPLLPAVFLLNPMLWRNVCPLATLNTIAGERVGEARLEGRWLHGAWAVGIILLVTLVPARRFLFNTDGPALALVIAGVAGLAVAGGTRYARRAGFCNAICPVLPVEKLYGQFPIVPVRGARCRDCVLCTPVGCTDLAGAKTMAQTLGPSRRSAGWIATPFGAFAVAFPGLIVGYFTTTNGALSTAPSVYLHAAGWSAASAAVLGVLLLALRAPARWAMPLLGALAFGLYYWLAAPGLSRSYGGGTAGTAIVRALALGLLTVSFARIRLGGSAAGESHREMDWRRSGR